MRIDRFESAATTEAVQQLGKVNTDKATGLKVKQDQTTEDRTSLSSGSDSVSTLTQAALQPQPTRAQKVESLKVAVNSAQYKLDSAKIAEALSHADV